MKIQLSKKPIAIPLYAEDGVGCMRMDFYNGTRANDWYEIKPVKLRSLRAEINEMCNAIMDAIPDFDWIVEMCGGEGLDKSINLFEESTNFIYRASLIPIWDSVHCRIYVYHKSK